MTTFGKLVSTFVVFLVLALVIVVLKPFKSWNLGNSTGTTTPSTSTLVVDTDVLTEKYINATSSYAVKYPAGYRIEEGYTYKSVDPSKDVVGTKFIIPPLVATGTNLSLDSYISVEVISQTATCTPALFMADKATSYPITENGTAYLVASSTGAAAGNRYEETVYTLLGAKSCVAVRYLVHYGVFENYPQGSVKTFDKTALLKEFDLIRKSLIVSQ